MEKGGISSRNMRSLLILMVMCGSVVNGAFTTEQDTWIAALMMGIVFFPAILMYARVCALLPGKGLYDIISSLFGRALSFAFILMMCLYALVVTALQLRNFTEFTIVIALQDTPPIPIAIALILPIIYLAKQGFHVLGRWSLIVCLTLAGNITLTFLLSLKVIDLSHLLPIMDNSVSEIASNSFALGSIAIGETVMAMILIGHLKKGKSSYGAYIPGIFMGVCMFAIVIFRNILILGPDMEYAAKFSTYTAVRIIEVGNFFERIESSISFVYILIGITKMTVFLSGASMGAARLLKADDYKRLLVPVGLLALAISTLVFNDVFEMFDLVKVYRYLALPFQILIPLVIWITAEIKTRRHRLLAAK